MVGKNNVGKSSVLLALQKLFISNPEIKDIDKKDGSKPVKISVKLDDDTILDLNSNTSNVKKINYFYFPTGSGLNNDFGTKKIDELIAGHKNIYPTICVLDSLKKQITEIVNLFTYIND
ncbi:MAG: hypothetical protein IIU11_02335, partial [Bacteroidales bacterium]|nr:hypothetical protein [Bacteroidales bacterium]